MANIPGRNATLTYGDMSISTFIDSIYAPRSDKASHTIPLALTALSGSIEISIPDDFYYQLRKATRRLPLRYKSSLNRR